jgi:colanic acid biosynthesis glycosyl transferase WcaI
MREEIKGVRINRCNLFKPRKPGIFGRMIHELSFAGTALSKLLKDRDRYDLIICIVPPFLLGLTAIIFSKFKKTRVLLHIQDLEIDAARELGMIKNKLLLSLLGSVERYIFKKVDTITTISDAMRQKIIEKGIESRRVGLFYNWADPGKITPLPGSNTFSKKHNLDGKFVVLHAGNMGEKQDIDIILKAAVIMSEEKDVCFLLVGNGIKKPAAERYVKEHGLANVLIMGPQPEEAVNEMLSSCSVALVTQDRNIKNCVMPSKALGPVCAEKPIIISAHETCEICKLAEEHKFGIIVPAGDAARLVEAIRRIKSDTKFADTLGKNGRLFTIEHRHFDKVLKRFEENLAARYSKNPQA